MRGARPKRSTSYRIVAILTWSVAGLVIGIAALFVIVSGYFHIRYAEPNPELSDQFAAVVRLSAEHEPPELDFGAVFDLPWDRVSIIGPFTGLESVRDCLGIEDWDQDGALADMLNKPDQVALVFSDGNTVSQATWSLWSKLPFEAPENLCAIPRGKAIFTIATRSVRDPRVGQVTVYRFEQNNP